MKKQLILFSAALALVASCGKQPEEGIKTTDRQKIEFSSSIGSFTKATDTAFESGDAIGVSAYGTTAFTNAKLTWGGNAYTSLTPLYWSKDQDKEEATDFAAYYPYSGSANGSLEFSVNPDQSTHALYTASDLMTATASATPAQGTVHFNFAHKLSQVVIKINNESALEVAEVYLSNVKGKVNLTVARGSVETTGTEGTIKAGEITLSDGSQAWALIAAPQTTVPEIMITTANGQQLTYEADEEIELLSGRRYSATITVSEDAVPTDFTSEITDWVDDADIQFSEKTPTLVEEAVAITVPTVGAEDNSSAFWSAFSQYFTIPSGGRLVVEFVNYGGGGENNWTNWNAVVTTAAQRDTDGYAEYFVLRADNYGWGNADYLAANLSMTDNIDPPYATVDEYWAAFREGLTEANVTMEIENSLIGTVSFKAESACADGTVYTETYTQAAAAGEAVNLFLTVDGSHLAITGATLYYYAD